MRAILRRANLATALMVAGTLCLPPSLCRAEIFPLKNGMVLEGSYGDISKVSVDPLKGTGETGVKPIAVIDNQLTRTLVPKKQLKSPDNRPPVATERILIPQRIPTSGQAISVVGRPLRIDPFDEFGHRIFSMVGAKGPIDVVQGITEITPRWTKVEAIEGINHYIWPMKIATSSIPREELSKILTKRIDPKNSDERLRIVKLYMQSERYQDARLELEQVIKDFPDLSHLKDVVKELHQLSAQRLLKEIELRREAGQYRLAVTMLEQFPAEGVAGETLLKVRELLEEIRVLVLARQKVLKLLDEHLAALKGETSRAALKDIVAEIKADLNLNTIDRLADYMRLADDEKMPAEQKVSLAVSGWLLGSGAAIDNLGVSISLVAVRDLVRQYLVTTRQPDRDNIISLLTSQEAATNVYVAAIIANMKPPVPTAIAAPPGADVGNPAAVLGLPGDEAAKKKDEEGGECAPKESDDSKLLKGQPKAAAPVVKAEPVPTASPTKPADSEPSQVTVQATGIPGLFELSVKTPLSESPVVKYWVQLPPEYDPYRRYPCVVTLNGATTPLQQIDWWAGNYNQQAQTRYGQATRHGYIVIAPQWQREHQAAYEYSAREHAAVLLPLRDACKRFAIDVDRVFLSGHSLGGQAAWDIGAAHPDLWAGLIPIVATPSKYVTAGQYWENCKYLPMYFVAGEKDTNTFANGTDWDRFLTKIGYDVMVVQYLGRGHEAFFDEIQNLFTWMNLHKRDFFPKEFTVRSLRPWDNFFWWIETRDAKEISTITPAEWGENPVPLKKPIPVETEVSPLAPNGVSVKSGNCNKLTVWLSPEIVKFDSTLKVSINGKRITKIDTKSEVLLKTLLEDVRTRGDRQHPFWAKVEWGG